MGPLDVHRTCVKCPEPGIYHGLDARKAIYCEPCFIAMVKHKFSSTIGKKRIFKGDALKDTLIVYEGNLSSAFMLWLIQQGLALDAHKKLQLHPVVLVLLTQSSEREIEEFVRHATVVRDILHTNWYFVHVSALLDDEFQPSTLSPSLNTLQEWNKLCASFKSSTARMEFARLCRTAICLRTAELLGVDKVMFGDSADRLSKDCLNALCLGRGSSLGDIAGVIDKRHPNVVIIRPLRDISELEIGVVNNLHDNERLVFNKNKEVSSKKAVQPLSEGLIEDLQNNGFKSTITTILSVASKVKALHAGEQRCNLCFTLYSFEEGRNNEFGCCCTCINILTESSQQTTIEKLFRVL
uniref:Cytoplasmic tRNA 2-thiolation protein 2 n=1 Tax=Steinernema glaseri TaxID=37863 RepID=A0A1I8ASW7_9BILA